MALGEDEAAVERFQGMIIQYPDGDHADRVALLLAQSLHRSGSVQGAMDRYRMVVRGAGDAFVPDAMYGLAVLLHRTDRRNERKK